MKFSLTIPSIALLLAICSCQKHNGQSSRNQSNQEVSVEALKEEIVKTEQEFAKMAKEEGLEKAFLFYAAEDAVINRNQKIYKGKEEIRGFFQNQSSEGVSLQWAPDFVEVSKSGDLGYTYGSFTYSVTDSLGKSENTGIFHTVWKKQPDGNWRYVWD